MTKLALTAVSLAIPVLISFPVQAQQRSVSELQRTLQTAVCQNDWNRAIELTGNLIGSDGISSDYRAQLMEYRTQLRAWRDAGARITNLPNCQNISPTAAVTLPAPQPANSQNWERAATSLNAGRPAGNPLPARTPLPGGSRVQSGAIARAQQCNQIGAVINPAMNETSGLVQNTTPQNTVRTIQRAIELAERTRSGLQAISLTDSSLRNSQQQLIANYGNLIPASRSIISAFERRDQAGVMNALNILIPIAEQEAVIIRAIASYCGQSPA